MHSYLSCLVSAKRLLEANLDLANSGIAHAHPLKYYVAILKGEAPEIGKPAAHYKRILDRPHKGPLPIKDVDVKSESNDDGIPLILLMH